MRLIFEHVAYIGCPRFLEPPPKGPGKEHDIRKHVKWMVKKYYRLMGWDEKTGKPLRSTLRRLGLDFIIKDLYD